MRWPIRLQLLLPMLSIVVLSIVLASGAVAWWRAAQVRRHQEDRLQRTVDTLAKANFPLTDAVLRQMAALSDAEFVLFDAAGSLQRSTLALDDADREPLRRVGAGATSEVLSAGRIVALGAGNYYGARVPLAGRLPGKPSGSLVVLYAEDRLSAIVKEAALPVLAAGAVVALVVLLVTTVLTHRIVRPIQLLGDRAAAIAGGDFTAVDVPRYDDEICDLTLSINRMTEQLGRYETEVRRSERLRTLGQLGAGMAHQLRNAAAGASMAVELHQRKCSDAADSESLEVAIRQLKLMESYLERFLTLGRPRPTKHERVVLQSVVADVLSLVDPACRHAKIDLNFQEPPEPICVEGDYESLRQLLVNLLLNAVEAAEREGEGRGRIIVKLDESQDGRALLSVQDTGPGPSAATEEELFEPFVTEKPDGTGLGLYVARQAAQEHGGSIAWQRRGGLTCFDVELPLLPS